MVYVGRITFQTGQNARWRGDRLTSGQKAYRKYLRSNRWQLIRALYLSDKTACEDCKRETQHLEVHHLSYRRRGHEHAEDLVAVCAWCHRGRHNRKNKPGLFGEKQTPKPIPAKVQGELKVSQLTSEEIAERYK